MQSKLTTLLASSLTGDHSTQRAHMAAPFPGRTETDAGVHNMTPLADTARAVDRNGKMGEGETKAAGRTPGTRRGPASRNKGLCRRVYRRRGFPERLRAAELGD